MGHLMGGVSGVSAALCAVTLASQNDLPRSPAPHRPRVICRWPAVQG